MVGVVGVIMGGEESFEDGVGMREGLMFPLPGPEPLAGAMGEADREGTGVGIPLCKEKIKDRVHKISRIDRKTHGVD